MLLWSALVVSVCALPLPASSLWQADELLACLRVYDGVPPLVQFIDDALCSRHQMNMYVPQAFLRVLESGAPEASDALAYRDKGDRVLVC